MKKFYFISLFLLLSCGKSQKVTVVENAHQSEFATGELRWNSSKFPIKLRVQASYFNTEAGNSLENAINSWNNALGLQALELEYIGNNVDKSTDPNFCDPSTNKKVGFPTENCNPNDNSQLYLSDSVYSVAYPSNWIISQQGVLALTSYTYQNKELINGDVIFNEEYFDFINRQNAVAPTNKQIDIETVFVHELGHFLGMSHIDSSLDPNSVMLPNITPSTIKRDLSTGDVDRINSVYK